MRGMPAIGNCCGAMPRTTRCMRGTHAGTWVRHEAFLLDSAFCQVDEVSVIERRQVTVEQLVDRAFSRSSTAPDRLGEAASAAMAADIEALLRPLAVDGMLTEVVATGAADRARLAGGRGIPSSPLSDVARLGSTQTAAGGACRDPGDFGDRASRLPRWSRRPVRRTCRCCCCSPICPSTRAICARSRAARCWLPARRKASIPRPHLGFR